MRDTCQYEYGDNMNNAKCVQYDIKFPRTRLEMNLKKQFVLLIIELRI